MGDEETPAFYDIPPDWVCEVISPRTERVERDEKMRIHRREGIKHIWLLSPLLRTFGLSDLHLDENPEWLVIADELGPTPSGELFGVLVTTGPATAQQAGIDELLEMTGKSTMWVEYIAIAPSLRPDCPAQFRRKAHVKAVGPQLMRAAIGRSEELGCDGRICLHAEGDGARETYTAKWRMRDLGYATHRAGGAYPVCFGDAAWAAEFCSGLSKRGRR